MGEHSIPNDENYSRCPRLPAARGEGVAAGSFCARGSVRTFRWRHRRMPRGIVNVHCASTLSSPAC